MLQLSLAALAPMHVQIDGLLMSLRETLAEALSSAASSQSGGSHEVTAEAACLECLHLFSGTRSHSCRAMQCNAFAGIKYLQLPS